MLLVTCVCREAATIGSRLVSPLWPMLILVYTYIFGGSDIKVAVYIPVLREYDIACNL